MDNPVDGVDNVGAVFAFLAAHPVVSSVLNALLFAALGFVVARVACRVGDLQEDARRLGLGDLLHRVVR